jgi:hypothetical protein
VASGVLRTVGFGLHDHARGKAFRGVMSEYAAEEVDRDVPGIPVVEGGL